MLVPLFPPYNVRDSSLPSSPSMPCKLCAPHVSLGPKLIPSLGVRHLQRKTCIYIRQRLRHAINQLAAHVVLAI